MTPRWPRVQLEGAPFDAVSESEVVDHVMRELDKGIGGWLLPMNVDVLLRWRRDPGIQELCRACDLILADGKPLLWAARLRGSPLPERIAGSTLISSLSIAAAQRGRSVYLLGGDPGTAVAAAHALCGAAPQLRVAGTHCPAFGFERDEAQIQQVRDSIRLARPDLVFVGLGFPKQERLIHLLRELAPQAWWMGVGISFSFLAGRVLRAPRWMQESGLEWAHRLAQEPGRLARRYLADDIPFTLGLLVRSAGQGLGRDTHLVQSNDTHEPK